MTRICDTCGLPIPPDTPALRRAITDGVDERGNPIVIGEWVWHVTCLPAGPISEFEQDPT